MALISPPKEPIMHKFEPGQKVTHVTLGKGQILANIEGWWDVLFNSGWHAPVRPSQLAPADPVPDAQTALVGAIIRAYSTTRSSLVTAEAHVLSKPEVKAAFAKYLREHEAKPVLTVEMVRAVLTAAGDAHHGLAFAKRLHATLTEQAK